MTEYFPFLLIILGLLSGLTAGRAVATGVNGMHEDSLTRAKQPLLFWAATIVEALLGLAMIIVGVQML